MILNRERQFWRIQANERKLPQGIQKVISEAMAMITLRGGAKDKTEVDNMLSKIPLLADNRIHERETIIELLHDLYPCHQAFTKHQNYNYIEPLQPDLLGEYLIEETLQNNPNNILSSVFPNLSDKDKKKK